MRTSSLARTINCINLQRSDTIKSEKQNGITAIPRCYDEYAINNMLRLCEQSSTDDNGNIMSGGGQFHLRVFGAFTECPL